MKNVQPPPSVSLRLPPTPGKGWAGNMEEKNVALKPCLSHFVGMETAPFKLASHRSSGREGDHEVVEAGARQAGYKTHRPQGDTTTL